MKEIQDYFRNHKDKRLLLLIALVLMTLVLVTVQTRGLLYFEPQEFVRLYYAVDQPDLIPIRSSPPITGNTEADERITALAKERGYRLQAIGQEPLRRVDGKPLQPRAAVAWNDLSRTAAEEGIRLEVVAGYRSIADQRKIFLNRLSREAEPRIGRSYTYEEIARGEADEAIAAVLKTSSIPGYSKHHTGYALDIHDAKSRLHYSSFEQTEGYRWLSANNFKNAKRFGFIPSYPSGTDPQGPDPEEWEYVWVGRDAVSILQISYAP